MSRVRSTTRSPPSTLHSHPAGISLRPLEYPYGTVSAVASSIAAREKAAPEQVLLAWSKAKGVVPVTSVPVLLAHHLTGADLDADPVRNDRGSSRTSRRASSVRPTCKSLFRVCALTPPLTPQRSHQPTSPRLTRPEQAPLHVLLVSQRLLRNSRPRLQTARSAVMAEMLLLRKRPRCWSSVGCIRQRRCRCWGGVRAWAEYCQ
jgi:hypothetical protein